MKFPNRDKDFRDMLYAISKKTGVPISKVEEAVESYFRTISSLIEWDRPVSIHIDYIGDLKFNQKQLDKAKENANRHKV